MEREEGARFHPDREDLAWAAGFFDGEGCFSYSSSAGVGVISIGQTNAGSLERFKAAVGGLGKVYGPYMRVYPGRFSKKPWYDYRAQRKEDVQAIAAMLWFQLGPIKRAQAKGVLKKVSPRCMRGHLLTQKRGCPRCVADSWARKRDVKRASARDL